MSARRAPQGARDRAPRRGWGKEIALGFARDGYDVAFADRDAAMLDEVMARSGTGRYVNAVPVTLELTSEASVKDGLNAAIEGLGGLDVVVNNAASGADQARGRCDMG